MEVRYVRHERIVDAEDLDATGRQLATARHTRPGLGVEGAIAAE
jgi:hypothetical protein